MYEQFFNLREKPFKLVPNPDYLYFSPSHARALSHLRYASTHGDGFVLITGEVGTGKTTLCRCYLDGLSNEYESAYIFNTKIDTIQLLHAICHEFGITIDRDAEYQTLLNAFNHFLMRQHQSGHKVVLLIDEAQNLTPKNLEMVRLLSNLETTQQKLLHIVLVGQPELAEKLESFELRQLSQRISLRCRLELLTMEQTQGLIKHRVMVAAKGPSDLFSSGACRLIHRYSGGIPRRINIAADWALLKAYEHKQSKVNSTTAGKAIHELQTDSKIPKRKSYLKTISYSAIGVAIVAAVLWFAVGDSSRESAVGTGNHAGAQDNETPIAQDHREASSSTSMHKIQITAEVSDSQPPVNEAPQATDVIPDAAVEEAPETPIDPIAPQMETIAPLEGLPVEAQAAPPTTPVQENGSSFAAQIAVLNFKASRMDALTTLLALWKQPSPNPGQLPESMDDEQFFHIAALQYGLRLLAVENDWPLVRRLNLPAVVALASSPGGDTVFATLTSWEGNTMQFAMGIDQYHAANTDMVFSSAKGPVYIFWYNSLGSDKVISQTSQGNTVLRVKELLHQIGYRNLALNPVFDSATYDAVIDFQIKCGIEPDGLVGPLTKIMLVAVSNTAVMPHLNPNP